MIEEEVLRASSVRTKDSSVPDLAFLSRCSMNLYIKQLSLRHGIEVWRRLGVSLNALQSARHVLSSFLCTSILPNARMSNG